MKQLSLYQMETTLLLVAKIQGFWDRINTASSTDYEILYDADTSQNII